MKPNTAAVVVNAAERDYETNRVMLIFDGSDGDATRALYDELAALGPVGLVAVNLFRAQKCSARAKIYHRGHYSTLAYGRKNWSLEQLADILVAHGEMLGYRFGWGVDTANDRYPWVLYVDLPQGQVSFHSLVRGVGPDYAGAWDGIVGASTGRILRFVNTVLHPAPPPLALVASLSESSHDQPVDKVRRPTRRRPRRRLLRAKRSR